MKKGTKKIYLFFVTTLAVITIFSASSVLALEVKYPNIFGVSIDSNSTLPQYVKYFFNFGLAVAGTLALISFALGAIGLMSPNLESHNDAKDRMKGSILGLILIMASFIIIQTINPKLATITISELPGVSGVYLTNGKDSQACPEQYADTSLIPQGFNKIQYCCDKDCKGGTGPNLLVWMYPKTNFQGNNNQYTGVNVERMKCGNKIDVNGKSFTMEFETSGVYMFLGQDCSGYASTSISSSRDRLEDPFRSNLKSIRIVNDQKNNLSYGAIFHKEIDLEDGGTCSKPLIDGLSNGCQAVDDGFCCNVGINASAADIFQLSKKSAASGDGITFYSEPRGWNSGQEAGVYEVAATKIKGSNYNENAASMRFNYANVNVIPAYYTKCVGYNRENCSLSACVSFKDCPKSIDIKGSYLVALYSSESYCQTFTEDAEDLNAEPIVASGKKITDLNNVYMIPVQ